MSSSGGRRGKPYPKGAPMLVRGGRRVGSYGLTDGVSTNGPGPSSGLAMLQIGRESWQWPGEYPPSSMTEEEYRNGKSG